MSKEPQDFDPRQWPTQPAGVITQFFNSLGKHVIYFAGYGELGYEDETCVRRVALQVLAEWSPTQVIVHAGTLLRRGGHDGIAQIYLIARELGFETTGIHPSVARAFAATHRVSPHCDHVFFVADNTWGGFLANSEHLSPTLQLHLAVSQEMIAIGGGKHTADEIKAFVANGKPVRYFPAEMNHQFTRQWAQSAGVQIENLCGAAYQTWLSLQANQANR